MNRKRKDDRQEARVIVLLKRPEKKRLSSALRRYRRNGARVSAASFGREAILDKIEGGTNLVAYRRAVEFVALNDDPGSSDSMDLEVVRGYTTVVLISETFSVLAKNVAKDVLEVRGSFLKEYESFGEKLSRKRSSR